MEPQEIRETFNRELFSDFLDEVINSRPLLAHYSSRQVLEQILKNEEIWFSNPLLMNDIEEVKFGIINGIRVIIESAEIKNAIGEEPWHEEFVRCLDHYVNEYDDKYLIDTYIFCFSEHEPSESDGLLSMWRGYGGNGNGAAIVFDTSKIKRTPNSPLIFAKVEYASQSVRMKWFSDLAIKCADILAPMEIPKNLIYEVAYAIFERIKIAALFSKHIGFKEEREWRIVYLRERDTNNRLVDMLGYLNGPNGIEPKLKLKIQPIDGVTDSELSLDNIIHSILLGPSVSSPMALRSTERMLELIGKGHYKNILEPSSIPYRPK